MASGVQKWLVGCGIGCGLMILAAGGIGTCGYVGVKNGATGNVLLVFDIAPE